MPEIKQRESDWPQAKPIYDRIVQHAAGQMRLAANGLPDLVFSGNQHRISAALIDRLRASGLNPPDLEPAATLARRIGQWLKKMPHDVLRPIGFDRRMPPSQLHMVARDTQLMFDLFNADTLEETLHNAGFGFVPGHRYLDFGCSTGRTVRTFQLAFPQSRFSGSDPVPSSIAWASRMFPDIDFTVTKQDPPTHYPDASFDGAYAKSIWTHFGLKSARAWLDEMARIIKPGGFMMFTAHGFHDLARRVVYGDPAPDYTTLAGYQKWSDIEALAAIADAMVENGFYFRAYQAVAGLSDLDLIEDASTAEWGLAFMTPDWVKAKLLPPEFKLVHHAVGRTGHRQDIYVLRRG